ncbi:hypothetical protein BCV72DRAFT_250978 [Rhizopus microsporus var. microsporus]|uniref:Uncharacterized protein n=1 Tax=Rhizopus microsporus var. microsporus TaxID=86635 RepID=A0A1X0QYL3_RHIZD|nr:hypothetical protein BCV72DRAFT_250978 [Rhizopus microsporus var. microsporus]
MGSVAIGKQAAERDPFTYQKYPSFLNFFFFLFVVLESSKSDDSIDSRLILQKPVANEEQHSYGHWSMEELVDLLNGFLAKDGRSGRSKICRVGATTVRMRSLWILKEEHRRDALSKVFNTLSYKKKVREASGNWLTVEYCRRSKYNVSQEQRAKLIQRMTEILKVICLCEKMYVPPPIFSTISPLLECDFSNNIAIVLGKIKYRDGHFQGKALKGRVLHSYLIKNY